MPDDSDESDLEQEFEEIKKHDSVKNALITKLFQREARLREALKKTKVQLKNQEILEEVHRGRADEFEAKLRNAWHKVSSSSFVLILIDGDCMPFDDSLVTRAKDGGHQAAILLKQGIETYMRNNKPNWPHDGRIIAHVYANFTGLSKTFKDAGIISNVLEFGEFVKGFNMENALFDFVDSGSGKECADEKLKENFKCYVNNLHCGHILFGGSADNGYARLLGSYSRNDDFTGRITLLRGPPFAKEMAELATRFQTTILDGVFRQKKIVPRRVSFQATPPASPGPKFRDAVEKNSSPTPIVTSPMPASGLVWIPPKWEAVTVLKNAQGQRIDQPLSADVSELAYMRENKHCVEFTKTGRCERGGQCEFRHDPKLSPKRLRALEFLTRSLPCATGLSCDDPECWYGHQCSRENCEGKKCRFKRIMHGIDTKVV